MIQDIPQLLDDALAAHIPTFTAGQLVRALLLVIAESNGMLLTLSSSSPLQLTCAGRTYVES